MKSISEKIDYLLGVIAVLAVAFVFTGSSPSIAQLTNSVNGIIIENMYIPGKVTGINTGHWEANPEAESIFAGSTHGSLYGFDHLGNNLEGFPLDLIPDDSYKFRIIGKPSVGQFDDDAFEEVAFTVFIENDTRVYFYVIIMDQSEFGPYFKVGYIPEENASTEHGNPILADIDNDGYDEIFIITNELFNEQTPVRIYAFEENAEHIEGWPLELFPSDVISGQPYRTRGSVTIGDLDGDSDLELVFPVNGKVYAYHHADLDGDGTIDPVEGSWPFESDSPGVIIHHAVSMGDVNGDGKMEVMVLADTEIVFGVDYSFNAYALDGNGVPLPGWPQVVEYDPVFTQPLSLGDIDNDGYPDIAAFDYDGDLSVFNGAGEKLDDFDINLGRNITRNYSSPVIADVDRDGYNEILLNANDKLVMIEENGTAVLILDGFASDISPIVTNLEHDQHSLSIVMHDKPTQQILIISTPEKRQQGWDQPYFKPEPRLPWAHAAQNKARTGYLDIPCSNPGERCVDIISPNGGEVFKQGEYVTVRWHHSANIDRLHLKLYLDYHHAETIDSNVDPTLGEYTFRIPAPDDPTNRLLGFGYSDTYRIGIIGYETGHGSVTEFSDASFSIVPFSNQPPNIDKFTATINGEVLSDFSYLGINVPVGTTIYFDVEASDPDGLGYPIFGEGTPDIKIAWNFDGASVPHPLHHFFNHPQVTFNQRDNYNLYFNVYDSLGANSNRHLLVKTYYADFVFHGVIRGTNSEETLEGVTVNIVDKSDGSIVHSEVTGPDGVYETPRLPFGHYEIIPSLEGYQMMSLSPDYSSTIEQIVPDAQIAEIIENSSLDFIAIPE